LLRTIGSAAVLTGDLTRFIRKTPDFEPAEAALQRAIAVLQAHPSEAGASLLRRILGILLATSEAFSRVVQDHDLRSDSSAARDGSGLSPVQKESLQTYLRRSFAGETKLQLGSVRPIVGGGSKLTLIVELRDARDLPAIVVVRADQATGVVESSVLDEYSTNTAWSRGCTRRACRCRDPSVPKLIPRSWALPSSSSAGSRDATSVTTFRCMSRARPLL
jgi:hypothetical protein